jgi:hypothetical protein
MMVPMAAPATPKLVGGMSEAFLIVYKIIAIVAASVFGLIFVLSIVDVIKYLVNEAKQKAKRFYDPNMYNKDTTDIEALRYISATTAEDETYNIFKTQKLISYIFLMVGMAVILLGVQLGLFLGTKIWSIFSGYGFKEQIELPMKMLALLLIIVVASFTIQDIYKQRFVKKVQTSLVELRTQLTTIRTFIYSNLTKDQQFLQALTADDLDGMSKVIMDTLKMKNGNCTNSTSPCDSDVEKMIFSMNLYSYLRYQIPSSDPNFENVTKLFTPDGVTNRTVDPTMYFYYNQPIYIANLYSSIRERIRSGYIPSRGATEDKEKKAATRERILMLSLNNKMQEVA